jgi:hypothetical protein
MIQSINYRLSRAQCRYAHARMTLSRLLRVEINIGYACRVITRRGLKLSHRDEISSSLQMVSADVHSVINPALTKYSRDDTIS